MKSVQYTVQRVVTERLCTTAFTSTTRIRDLDADSLDLIQIVMDLEDEIGIKVPDVDIERFITVGDLVEYFDDKKQGQEQKTDKPAETSS